MSLIDHPLALLALLVIAGSLAAAFNAVDQDSIRRERHPRFYVNAVGDCILVDA